MASSYRMAARRMSANHADRTRLGPSRQTTDAFSVRHHETVESNIQAPSLCRFGDHSGTPVPFSPFPSKRVHDCIVGDHHRPPAAKHWQPLQGQRTPSDPLLDRRLLTTVFGSDGVGLDFQRRNNPAAWTSPRQGARAGSASVWEGSDLTKAIRVVGGRGIRLELGGVGTLQLEAAVTLVLDLQTEWISHWTLVNERSAGGAVVDAMRGDEKVNMVGPSTLQEEAGRVEGDRTGNVPS